MIAEQKYYTYIYRDPSKGNEPIYVGKGCGNRAYAHLVRTDNHPLTCRIKNIRNKGREPDVSFLAKDVFEEVALLIEMDAIEFFGRRDLRTGTLLNLTSGGQGGFSPSSETRAKLSFVSSNPSDATRAKLSEGSLRFHKDPVKRANYMKGRAKTFTETWVKHNAEAQHARFENPAARKKLSDIQKVAQNRPDVLARNIAMITEVHNRPEVKASKSVKMKAYWASRRAQIGA